MLVEANELLDDASDRMKALENTKYYDWAQNLLTKWVPRWLIISRHGCLVLTTVFSLKVREIFGLIWKARNALDAIDMQGGISRRQRRRSKLSRFVALYYGLYAMKY